MKCPYCNDKIALVDWAQHSQECERRKAVRDAVRQETESLKQLGILAAGIEAFPVMAQGHEGPPVELENMTRGELIEYLAFKDVDHDPKAKKKDLLKLAKGE